MLGFGVKSLTFPESEPFTPASIADLAVWLRGDSGITSSVPGTDLSWTDRVSGSEWTTSSNAPLQVSNDTDFGGKACVRYTASSGGGLSGPSASSIIGDGATGATRVMVYAIGGGYCAIASGWGECAVAAGGCYAPLGGTFYNDFCADNPGEPGFGRYSWSQDVPGSTALILTLVANGSDWKAFVNGAQVFSAANNVFTVPTQSTLIMGPLTSGATTMAVAEDLVYKRELSADELEALNAYLADYYSISGVA